MKYALVNPAWTFDGSIYFGCREPHLPLEFGYARALLEADGHEVHVIDAQLDALDTAGVAARVRDLAPDATVVTTTPSYLFWRCPPPELRVPIETVHALREHGGVLVAVGPHGSTTPKTTLQKLGVDGLVMGECEEVLRDLARADHDFARVQSVAWRTHDGSIRVQGGPAACDMQALPALRWSREALAKHRHHHHRFDREPSAPGAEMEASRGCPYHCTFCAKDNYRDKYRKRPLATVIDELDALVAHGVEYVYFIDEIFLPDRPLLEAIAARKIHFGIQTRIDLWSLELLDLLGSAGCSSIEAGVESITVEGRALLDKKCKLSTNQLSEKLIHAKKTVPFVQATLMESKSDDPDAVHAWRKYLEEHGVWANEPVPLFPYPGSPDYTRLWGLPDERAWERAHDFYLGRFETFSDVQERRPVRLPILEGTES
jgi:B12-binding domain/radical SAM domain protein of rhizo-twelve system